MMEGQRIGSYRVVRKLGEGGMGAVYEVVHEQIGRRAAIKLLHPNVATDPQVTTRFLNEARAASIIEHPGIVEIFEVGQTPQGAPYIVMEFLKGEPLGERMKRQRGQMGQDALRLSRQIASALCAAHEKKIIHRDLKPANVMIVPDPEMPGGERIKVLDFGIAKLAPEHHGPAQDQTRTGALMGTPAYMSPEQCRGAGAVDEKTDVYALGVILYAMLAGRLPFISEGSGEVMAMHMYAAPVPLAQLNPALPSELAALVHRMLGKSPMERPTMAQAAQELEGLRQGPIGAGSLAHAAVVSGPAVTVVNPLLHAAQPSTLGQATGQRAPGPRWRQAQLVAVVAALALGLGTAVWVLVPRAPVGGPGPAVLLAPADVATSTPVKAAEPDAGVKDEGARVLPGPTKPTRPTMGKGAGQRVKGKPTGKSGKGIRDDGDIEVLP